MPEFEDNSILGESLYQVGIFLVSSFFKNFFLNMKSLGLGIVFNEVREKIRFIFQHVNNSARTVLIVLMKLKKNFIFAACEQFREDVQR